MIERNKRAWRLTLLLLGVGIGGVGYLLAVRLTGFGIPCLFYEVTGLLCPGCGLTHAAVAFSRGAIREGLGYNPMLPVYLLYGGWFGGRGAVRYLRGEKNPFLFGPSFVHTVMLIAVIVFGILRNIF